MFASTPIVRSIRSIQLVIPHPPELHTMRVDINFVHIHVSVALQTTKSREMKWSNINEVEVALSVSLRSECIANCTCHLIKRATICISLAYVPVSCELVVSLW